MNINCVCFKGTTTGGSTTTPSLFGSSQPNTSGANTSFTGFGGASQPTGLFGGSTNTAQPTTSSLFSFGGASQQKPAATTGIFGGGTGGGSMLGQPGTNTSTLGAPTQPAAQPAGK